MGSTITVAATGPQADEALTALAALVGEKFGEDE
jgi:phosphocarrier protein